MQNKGTNKSFEGQSFYIGIDSHKKSWKVTILGEQYEHKTMSQDPNPELLAAYMKRNFPGGQYHAIYEAGFNGFTSCRRLNELGVKCNLIHAADVPTSQKEKLQKTDKADSRKLARMLRGKELTPIDIPKQELEADRALVRQRFRVVKDLSRIKNRVKSLLFQFGIDIPDSFTTGQTRHWSRVYIDWLKQIDIGHDTFKHTLENYVRLGEILRQELLVVNRQVRNLSKLDRYQKNFNFLISMPGIGLITAITFLVQIGNIRRFKKLDSLCNYVGLVPSMYGSGDKVRTGKITKRGRKELKIMLIEASWDAIRLDPAMMLKFNELIKRMNKNKAIIRIARKMLSRMRYVLMHQEEYDTGVLT